MAEMIPYWARGLLGGSGKEVGPAMKEVKGERIYPKGLPAPEVTAKITTQAAKAGPLAGLLSTAAAADELNSAFNPVKRAGDIEQMGREAKANEFAYGKPFPTASDKSKGYLPEAQKAQDQMMGIVGRAVDAGVSAAKPENKIGSELLKATPAPQVAAIEQKRQVVEAGAKEQLRTNQLSRPKAAEAVVQADIQRTGEKITPEEMKTRVNQEVASMKTMDNDQLSKYLSYALIAGGLIASHLDESGAAGQAFAGGFNAQLDRNQQAALFKAKQQAAADAAAQEGAFKTRELDIKETEAASKAADRKADNTLNETKTMALLSKWEQEAANADAKLAAYRERTNATAAGGSKNAPKGTPLSDKENISAINAYAESNGMEVDPAAASSLANQLKFLQKERPGQTMKTYIDTLFKMGGYGKSTEDGFFSDTTTLKLQ